MTNSPAEAASGPEMMANLREIARWVKLSGTAEEREALAFIDRRMQDYGYRTQVLLHDAYISLPGRASVLVDGAPVTAITQSFSRTSPAGGLAGVPVYVGHGGEADFEGRDLRGRILLIEGMATPAASQRASRAGAAGQLHISHHEHIHEMCISPVWGNPGASTLDGLPTTVVCSVNNTDGGAIREALAAGKQPVVTLHAEVDTGWRKTPILVADLDGAEDSFVLLSGHHDTWYFGVMDNGSANAGMMEVARLCAQHRAQWKRGLRVCFWSGHSHGRYSGSAWYADAHWDELDRRCVAHVNVDSLGGTGASVLSNAAAMSALHALAADAITRHTNQAYTGKRKNRSSDDSFVGVGIPSMFGTLSEQQSKHAAARNALGWWWHTPHDLIDKVDEANLVRDARVMTEVVWRLLATPVPPLDHAATAASLLGELANIEAALAGRFDVAPLVRAATALRDASARVTDRAVGASGAAAAAATAALMRASRALVPADYTAGDRFTHPHALPMPDWATLQPIRDLAATVPGSDAEKFTAVDALRARNRVAFALREAQAAIDDALAALA